MKKNEKKVAKNKADKRKEGRDRRFRRERGKYERMSSPKL